MRPKKCMQNKPNNGGKPARPTFHGSDTRKPNTGRAPKPGFAKTTQRPAQARSELRNAPRPQNVPAKSNANARLVALNVLCDVLENDAYASLSLDDRLGSVNLNQLDRRLCASIVYRTLENLYYLDYALGQFLQDADALNMKVRNILRTAACQILLHDRVPDSAAVNEAVKLTREVHLDPFAGMVNAVLRRLTDHKENLQWPKPDEGAHYLSVMYSVPEWLAQCLIDDYGREEAEKIASYRTEKHFITIRATYGGREEDFEKMLSRKVWETQKGIMPGAVHVFGAMQIARDSDYIKGTYSIQGEGSMLAAAAVDAKHGMNVLDCCAAPGGKTAYIAERMEGTGRVYAWDLHPHRVELIRAAMQRLHLDNVRTAARDAAQLREDLVQSMDAVLLDAPCSGLGVMDDKPDVKYRHTKESLAELCETQQKLLDTCCRYVRPGGTLVYSTCSLLKDENERQISRFLCEHPEFEIAPLPDTIPAALRAHYGEYGLQLLPYRDGIDGFFVARMKRI